MRATEFITEVFEPNYDLPLLWRNNPMEDIKSAVAKDAQGRRIEINFWEFAPDAVEIDFSIDDEHEQVRRPRGQQFPIFALVIQAIREYMQSYKPNYVTFSGKGSSRYKLYTAMVLKFAQQMGYSMQDPRMAPESFTDYYAFDDNSFFLKKKNI
jgi:hypothetical protein